MQTPESQPPAYGRRPAAPPGARPPWMWWLVGGGGCGCLALVAIFVIAIGALRPHKAPPPFAYVGQWAAQDGTMLDIASDGSTSYRAPASSIAGGGVVVDEAAGTLRVTLGPFRKTWRIDAPPREVNGATEMTLDGVAFRRGASVQSAAPAPPQASMPLGAPEAGAPGATVPTPPSGMPTDEEVKQLTTQTLLLFNQGLQTGDFSALESQASATFRQDNPPARLKAKFRQFFAKHLSIAGIATATQVFEPDPSLDAAGDLTASGYYTTPRRVFFTLVYTREGGVWKLARIRVEM